MGLRTLLLATPFSSPNYVYPGPAYLARHLRRLGREVSQADLSLETLLRLFSSSGLERLFATVAPRAPFLSPAAQRLLKRRDDYVRTVDVAVRFLKGRDPALAYRLAMPAYLPRGESFEVWKGFDWLDGDGITYPVHDRARFVCTQYLYDLAALVREAVFPYFQITLNDRFCDDFVHWCVSFDRMREELERPPNVVDQLLLEALDATLEAARPHLVGVSVPFARNLYWSLRIARHVKERDPGIVVVAGGGLLNTAMRGLREPRLFDYVDYVTLDDGERPLAALLEHLEGKRPVESLKRTFFRRSGEVRYADGDEGPDPSHQESGAPDYTGYRLDDYFSPLETLNASQRIYGESWWNKLTMAHGCYWKKCAFCDIHLSYIGDYRTASASGLVDKVEEVIAQTGRTGFHFVDEALPPKVMREFAQEVLRRGLQISWHGMLRFDRAFTPELCSLLAASGLVAAYGGLEVASDRVLALMKKGTTVAQVARVCSSFRDAGILVHGYLMYGFPSQTAQETVDALEVVRQLFKSRLLSSASWARFAVTPHSPVGRAPAEYGIELLPVPGDAFVEQIYPHHDPANDHLRFKQGLDAALSWYVFGLYQDLPVERWFDFPVPPVSLAPDLIARAIADPEEPGAAERSCG